MVVTVVLVNTYLIVFGSTKLARSVRGYKEERVQVPEPVQQKQRQAGKEENGLLPTKQDKNE